MWLALIFSFASVIITSIFTAQAEPTANLSSVSLTIITEPQSSLGSKIPEIVKTSYNMMTSSPYDMMTSSPMMVSSSEYGDPSPVMSSSEPKSLPISSSSFSPVLEHLVTSKIPSPTTSSTSMKISTPDAVVPDKPKSTSMITPTASVYQTSSPIKLKKQAFKVTMKITSEKYKKEYDTSIRAFKEKGKEIEKQFDRIFEKMTEYVYAEVVKFSNPYLGCEILVHTESADKKAVTVEEIQNILEAAKNTTGGFGNFVVGDIDVEERKEGQDQDDDDDDDDGETWGVSIIIISILCAICLLLILALIYLCVSNLLFQTL